MVENAKKLEMNVQYMIRMTRYAEDGEEKRKKTTDFSLDIKTDTLHEFETYEKAEESIKKGHHSYFANFFYEIVKVYVHKKGKYYQ